MSDNWYYEFNGKPMGPVPLTDLMLLLSGRASPNDVLVWGSGFTDWQEAGTVPAINAEFVRSRKTPEAPLLSPSGHAYFQADNEEVEVFERGLVLRRRGLHLKRDRSIPFSDIVAVHFRDAGFSTSASITFALEQGSEKPSWSFAFADPNSVLFHRSQQQDYIKLRKFLETKIKSQTAIAANPVAAAPMPPSKKYKNLGWALISFFAFSIIFYLLMLILYPPGTPGTLLTTASGYRGTLPPDDACSKYSGKYGGTGAWISLEAVCKEMNNLKNNN